MGLRAFLLIFVYRVGFIGLELRRDGCGVGAS